METLICCCCFGDIEEDNTRFDYSHYKVVSCRDGHLCCFECMERATQVAVGDQKKVECMDSAGCTAGFSSRMFNISITNDNLKRAYDNILSDISTKAANIENFYACPFCNNGAILEIPIGDQPNFSCYGCKMDSCRSCRKTWHVGPCDPSKHCKDEEETQKYLITCCGKSFYRGDGCNKVMCTTCRAYFCWICKSSISKTKPYHHFSDKAYGGKGTCILFGDTVEIPVNPVAEQAVPRVNIPNVPVLPVLPIIVPDDVVIIPPRGRVARNIRLCKARKQDGLRCNYKATKGKLCMVHKKQKDRLRRKVREQRRNHQHLENAEILVIN